MRTFWLLFLTLFLVSSPAYAQGGVDSIQGDDDVERTGFISIPALTHETGGGTDPVLDPAVFGIAGLVPSLEVANIFDPSAELNARTGDAIGSLLLVYEESAFGVTRDAITLYRVNSAAVTEDIPRFVDSGDAHSYEAIAGMVTQELFSYNLLGVSDTYGTQVELFLLLALAGNQSAGLVDTGILFYDSAGPKFSTFLHDTLTASRGWVLPDASGYVALTDRADGTNLLGYVSAVDMTSYIGYFRIEVDGQEHGTIVGDGTEGNPWIFGFTSDGAPSGPAGGSLTGTYPNPGIANDAVGDAELNGADDFTFTGDNLFNGNNEIANALTLSADTLVTGAVSGDLIAGINDFRLTGTTATPVMTTSTTGLSTIYLTPYTGNRIGLFDGSNWTLHYSAQISLAMSGLTANRPYDIFVYDSGGPTLELASWSSDTARTTALVLQDGVWCKTGALTRRYVGTVYNRSNNFDWRFEADGAAVRLDLWNVDNRVPVYFRQIASTNSWNYTTATWRQAQGSTNYQIDVMVGLAETPISIDLIVTSSNTSANVGRAVSIGYESTTTPGGVYAASTNGASYVLGHGAHRTHQPGIGQRAYTWLEYSAAGVGTTTFYGDNASNLMQSGMTGVWNA